MIDDFYGLRRNLHLLLNLNLILNQIGKQIIITKKCEKVILVRHSKIRNK